MALTEDANQARASPRSRVDTELPAFRELQKLWAAASTSPPRAGRSSTSDVPVAERRSSVSAAEGRLSATQLHLDATRKELEKSQHEVLALRAAASAAASSHRAERVANEAREEADALRGALAVRDVEMASVSLALRSAQAEVESLKQSLVAPVNGHGLLTEPVDIRALTEQVAELQSLNAAATAEIGRLRQSLERATKQSAAAELRAAAATEEAAEYKLERDSVILERDRVVLELESLKAGLALRWQAAAVTDHAFSSQ